MSPAFPCARCGRPVRRNLRATPPRITCPRCRYLIYDYPRPAAGMLVVKRGAVLVLRRGHAPMRGHLDIPGGFGDAGESIVLGDVTGAKRTLARSSIAKMKASAVSLRPEGLWQNLDAQQQRDLMAFLLTEPPAKTTPGR